MPRGLVDTLDEQAVLISVPDGQQIEQGMSCPLQARGDLHNITSNKATRPATHWDVA